MWQGKRSWLSVMLIPRRLMLASFPAVIRLYAKKAGLPN